MNTSRTSTVCSITHSSTSSLSLWLTSWYSQVLLTLQKGLFSASISSPSTVWNVSYSHVIVQDLRASLLKSILQVSTFLSRWECVKISRVRLDGHLKDTLWKGSEVGGACWVERLSSVSNALGKMLNPSQLQSVWPLTSECSEARRKPSFPLGINAMSGNVSKHIQACFLSYVRSFTETSMLDTSWTLN